MVPEIVGPGLLAACCPRQPGLIPNAVEHFPTVAAVTGLPVEEAKNVRRDGPNLFFDAYSQAASTSATSAVIGSLRLRLPLDHITSMCRPATSMCSASSARASPVLIPHECISVKNATACQRHGESVSRLAAAPKNNPICRLVSR